MKVGFCLPSEGPLARPEAIARLAESAEGMGFHAVSLSDHVVIPQVISAPYPYSADHKVGFPPDVIEQMTTLSYLAGRTSKVKLMTSIMVVPHRNPVLAAKMIANLDLLSGGRVIVGAGAGWLGEEFEALGAPPFEERGRVFDEYIEVYRELWDKEVSSYDGRYVKFSEVVLAPKPVQKPRIPIWVGGESPSAMRRAARIGDGWYPTPNNPSRPMKTLGQLKEAVNDFRAEVKKSSRSMDDMTVGLGDVKPRWREPLDSGNLFSGDPQKIVRDIGECEAAGIGYLGFNIRGRSLDETVENMGFFAREVLAAVS